jgi:uncharacterized 2Fe-2S/4Fe-4S cluster protein (DUF4445 family)
MSYLTIKAVSILLDREKFMAIIQLINLFNNFTIFLSRKFNIQYSLELTINHVKK